MTGTVKRVRSERSGTPFRAVPFRTVRNSGCMKAAKTDVKLPSVNRRARTGCSTHMQSCKPDTSIRVRRAHVRTQDMCTGHCLAAWPVHSHAPHSPSAGDLMPAAAGAADAGAADQGVKPSCCCVPPRLLLTLLLLHSQPTFGLAGINETTTSTSSASSMCLPAARGGGCQEACVKR